MDYHRSCPACEYQLCITCCKELRLGCRPGAQEKQQQNGSKTELESLELAPGQNSENPAQSPSWVASSDGSIPCPPTSQGGCGRCELGLKTLFEPDWMAKLTMNAEMESYNARSEHDLVRCSICASACGDVKRKKSLRLASHRKGEDDNYLYCPSRQIVEEEGVAHFQKHWVRGEPVIVCNVLEGGSGLSWEPMVMWRAVRETTKNKFERDTRTVAAIDCLDWQEVKVDQIKVSLNQFYSEIHPFVVYGLGYMSSELLVIQRLAIDIHVNWWSLGCAG